jgi:hypothetical protein
MSTACTSDRVRDIRRRRRLQQWQRGFTERIEAHLVGDELLPGPAGPASGGARLAPNSPPQRSPDARADIRRDLREVREDLSENDMRVGLQRPDVADGSNVLTTLNGSMNTAPTCAHAQAQSFDSIMARPSRS